MSDEKSFQYAKAMLQLFRAIVKIYIYIYIYIYNNVNFGICIYLYIYNYASLKKLAILSFSDRYELLDKPNGQVILMVEDFIQQTSLPVYMPEEMQCILNANDLAADMIELVD